MMHSKSQIIKEQNPWIILNTYLLKGQGIKKNPSVYYWKLFFEMTYMKMYSYFFSLFLYIFKKISDCNYFLIKLVSYKKTFKIFKRYMQRLIFKDIKKRREREKENWWNGHSQKWEKRTTEKKSEVKLNNSQHFPF